MTEFNFNFLDGFIKTNYFNFAVFNHYIETTFVSKLATINVDSSIIENLHPFFAEHYMPLKTPSDGNCLWHMVSRSLCGNLSLTRTLKNLTVVTLLMLKDTFLKILKNELKSMSKTELELQELTLRKYRKMIVVAKTDYEWGDEYHLLAISTFLSMDIYIFSYFEKALSKDQLINSFNDKFNKSGLHLIYEPIKNTVFDNLNNKKIIYGFFDPLKSHYTSLIPQTNDINNFVPTTNLFKKYC
jgi:hypothetical protein